MVHPRHVHVLDGALPYESSGGRDAISAVIDRYYDGDVRKQVEALKVYQDFRTKFGYFGTEKAKYVALNDSSDNFWKLAAHLQPEGSELFRKLCNGYSGQGESERMNKQVKKFRTTVRNRQTHQVTSAYMELDTVYKMEKKNEEYNKVENYMLCLREKILQIEEDYVENQMLAAEALDEAQVDDDVNEEDEVADAEFAVEIDDQGMNALILLLSAAEQLEE